jgi:hypothetical protein
MLAQNFVLPAMLSRERAIERIATVLSKLAIDRAWRVSVVEHKPKRSDSQNRYLWAIYGEILAHGGDLQGWTKEDCHEFFLGEHFGWEVLQGFGKRRMKPLRRSSVLNKQEFSDYIAFIQRFMAERGVYIDDPHEVA